MFEFYVPTLQCSDAGLCQPFERRYEKHKPYELEKMFDYSKAICDFFGL